MELSSKYGAVIVLGGGREKNGALTQLSTQRLDKGVLLYKEGFAVSLVALGGHESTYRPNAIRFVETGADLRARYFIGAGVDPGHIIKVENGKDTIGEAFASRIAMSAMGLSVIGLVTSDVHMERALFIFHRIFGKSFEIDGISVPCGDLLNPAEEVEYLGVVRDFFASFPQEIPDPNLDTWHVDNGSLLYGRYKLIHDKYHPPGDVQSQAYYAVNEFPK